MLALFKGILYYATEDKYGKSLPCFTDSTFLMHNILCEVHSMYSILMNQKPMEHCDSQPTLNFPLRFLKYIFLIAVMIVRNHTSAQMICKKFLRSVKKYLLILGDFKKITYNSGHLFQFYTYCCGQ